MDGYLSATRTLDSKEVDKVLDNEIVLELKGLLGYVDETDWIFEKQQQQGK